MQLTSSFIEAYKEAYSLLHRTCKTQEEFNEKMRKVREDLIKKYGWSDAPTIYQKRNKKR